ncbi:MAG: hypothetical protein RR063_10830, partial [Anaerovoracaceae bacterium]
MKKFLTVLLALSVVFTYTFGTAFATIGADDVSSIKSAVGLKTAELQGALTGVGTAYVQTLTFNQDGLLIASSTAGGGIVATGFEGLVSKKVIEDAVNEAIGAAQRAFAT